MLHALLSACLITQGGQEQRGGLCMHKGKLPTQTILVPFSRDVALVGNRNRA